MDKLKMRTPDLTDGNIAKISERDKKELQNG